MRNPYDVLGLPKDSAKEALTEKYNELKAVYGEARFLPGEEGNEGARKLTELESAWLLVSADLKKQEANQDFGNDFGYVDAQIKESNFDTAQNALDEMKERSAEWHYYQSIIYYKREWMAECRKHLVLAVDMDPQNAKFRSALEKLDLKMANPTVDPNTIGPNQEYAQQAPPNEQVCGGNALANCCATMCCMDCCCSMSRCC